MDPKALITQLGSECAVTLSSSLDRVSALASAGVADPGSLGPLYAEIARVRQAGIMAQQLLHLSTGRVNQDLEPLNLAAMLADNLQQNQGAIKARGLEVNPLIGPAEVVCDHGLAHLLTQTLMEWSLQHAKSRIDLRLAIKSWPAQARITCSFTYRSTGQRASPADAAASAEAAPELDSMAWRLLEAIAGLMQLQLHRQDGGDRSAVVIEFPQTLALAPSDLQGMEAGEPELEADSSMPLAGRRVLLVTPRLSERDRVQETLRGMGLKLFSVAHWSEARWSGANGLPDAVIYDETLDNDDFARWRATLLARAPHTAMICMDDKTQPFEIVRVGLRDQARINRLSINEALPAALLFELTRQA